MKPPSFFDGGDFIFDWDLDRLKGVVSAQKKNVCQDFYFFANLLVLPLKNQEGVLYFFFYLFLIFFSFRKKNVFLWTYCTGYEEGGYE
jgi:hypothetical protein